MGSKLYIEHKHKTQMLVSVVSTPRTQLLMPSQPSPHHTISYHITPRHATPRHTNTMPYHTCDSTMFFGSQHPNTGFALIFQHSAVFIKNHSGIVRPLHTSSRVLWIGVGWAVLSQTNSFIVPWAVAQELVFCSGSTHGPPAEMWAAPGKLNQLLFHCCDKMPWLKHPKGESARLSSQLQRDTVHGGRKTWRWAEKDTAVVRTQGTMNACAQSLSSSLEL